MHILTTANAAWNIWNFRRPVVASLLSESHPVTVLAPSDDSDRDLERLGCAFVPLEMNAKGLNPAQDMKLVRQFRHHFGALRPDAIVSYTIKNNIFGAFAARSSGIPFLPNVSGLGTAFLAGGLLQTLAEHLYRRAFRRLPIVFFQNSDDSDLFVERRLVTRDQVRLLPGSGIDLSHFAASPLPPEDEAPVFLMIARILRDKGAVEFAEAARQVKARVPRARFQILGAIGSENRTAIDAATVRTWQDEGLIEHLGTTADVRPFIEAVHCVVLPSYREGAPRTLIEAAAMARPLITTDVPGCRSIVDDAKSGLLCEVRSSASLAAACLRFLDMPHAAKVAMGQAGRAKMEREFDEAIVVRAYRDALDELTAQATPHAKRSFA